MGSFVISIATLLRTQSLGCKPPPGEHVVLQLLEGLFLYKREAVDNSQKYHDDSRGRHVNQH